jgi:hypothetical protein
LNINKKSKIDKFGRKKGIPLLNLKYALKVGDFGLLIGFQEHN